jgi:hypothetical protein
MYHYVEKGPAAVKSSTFSGAGFKPFRESGWTDWIGQIGKCCLRIESE